jgi:Fe-S cluster assembly scaffold protein SufB
VFVAAPGVAPHVLVDPDHLDAVEAVLVIDQDASAFGQHVTTVAASIAANDDLQLRRSPAARFVGETADHRVARCAFAATAPAALIGLKDAAQEDSAVGLEPGQSGSAVSMAASAVRISSRSWSMNAVGSSGLRCAA